MNMMFYFAPMSTATITEFVLAELGIDCKRVELDISNGDTRKPEFLAVNPNGRVPVIVHDGTAIWESAAITMYLGELFGVASNLYPAPGPKRGEVMKWIVWSNVTFAEAASRLSASLPSDSDGAVQSGSQDWVPPEQRSAIALDKAKSDLATCLGILDRAFSERPFLIGDYSLADTHAQGFVGYVASMGVDLSPFARVVAWLARCDGRPAIATVKATWV